jgi:hypothetical protein
MLSENIVVNKSRNPALGAALLAGGIANGLNTLALKAADLISLPTAKGGLLRLIAPWCAPVLRTTGVSKAWSAIGGPAVKSQDFQIGFHLAVGIAMAIFYAVALEQNLPGRPVTKGLLYALAVWLLNALVLLPATGEGIAGSAHLTAAGMLWFAAAHTLFFVALAVLYAAFRARNSAAATPAPP